MKTDSPIISGSSTTQKVLICLLSLVFLVLATTYLFVGALSEDEGWYLTAGKMVFQGRSLYHDFMYTQAPLLPYAYGAIQELFGESLYVGRLTSLLLGLIAVLATAAAAWRLRGPIASIMCLAALSLNPMVLHHLTIAKTYSLTVCLLSLGLLALASKREKTLKYGLCTAALCLAAGVRLSTAAAIPVFLLTLLIPGRSGFRQFLLNGVFAVVLLTAIFLPFVLQDAEAAWFDNVGFHTITYGHSSLFYGIYEKLDNLGTLANNLFVLLAASVAGLALFMANRGGTWLEAVRSRQTYVQIGAITGAIFVANLVPRAMRWDYFIVCIPGIAILGGCAVARLFDNLTTLPSRRVFTATLAAMLLFNALSGNHNLDVQGRNLPLSEVYRVSEWLQENTTENDKILTLHSYISIASDRELLPGLEMGVFSYYPEWGEERATRFGVVNDTIIRRYLERAEAAAVLVTDADFGRSSTLQTLDPVERQRNNRQTLELIDRNYDFVEMIPSFGQWKENLRVYLRRSSTRPIER